MTRHRPARPCVGRNSKGEPCRSYAIQGATVCRSHGGATPQVKAKAAVRVEVMSWAPGTPTEDASEVMLALVSQAWHRTRDYALELDRIRAEHGTLHEALVGDEVTIHPLTGAEVKTGEYVKAMLRIEAEERDRAMNFSRIAIQAGLDERRVRIAEKQTDLVERALMATLADMGLDDVQQADAAGRMARHLVALEAG